MGKNNSRKYRTAIPFNLTWKLLSYFLKVFGEIQG